MRRIFACLIFLCSTSAVAGFIPFGVQNDVAQSTITDDWQWRLCHSSNYQSSVSIADLFNECNGDYVMLGAGLSSATSLSVAAAALYSDVTQYTSWNETHLANGAQWYFNAYSMGFAGEGDTIYQQTADVEGLDETDRMSWHTRLVEDSWAQDATQSPLYVYNGWRVGDESWIYEGTDWNRYIYTYSSSSAIAVSEPASFGLFLVALGFIVVRRKQLPSY